MSLPGEIQVDFHQAWGDFGETCRVVVRQGLGFGQVRAGVDHIWDAIYRSWSGSVKIGPLQGQKPHTSKNPWGSSPGFGRFWFVPGPGCAEVHHNRADGRILPDFRQIGAAELD